MKGGIKMKDIITRKEFLSGKFETIAGRKKEHPVATLLRTNSEKAFSVNAIAKATSKAKSTINFICRKLVKKGLILHRSPHYMWKMKTSRKPVKKK